jgi:hypothetical protein
VDWIQDLASTVSFESIVRRELDWREVGQVLPFVPPIGYRDYVERFPPGRMNGSLRVAHPGGPLGSHEVLDFMHSYGGAYESIRDVEQPIPFDFFPTAGGLIPWAGWSTSLMLAWLPSGSPDDWPIVACNDNLEYQTMRGTVAECLTKLITHFGDWPVVSERFWEEDPTFVPDALASIASEMECAFRMEWQNE